MNTKKTSFFFVSSKSNFVHTSQDETLLPNGREFQRLIEVVQEGDTYISWLKNLKMLQAIIVNDNSTEDEKEEARDSVITTLKILRGILQQFACQLTTLDEDDDDERLVNKK